MSDVSRETSMAAAGDDVSRETLADWIADVSRETSRALDPLDVSRETLALLEAFVDETERWSSAVQLVSSEDRSRLWERHIIDSCGLMPWVAEARSWTDLGSGGGYPVVVLACFAKAARLRTSFVAVEADVRKASFLRSVSLKFGLPLEVQALRIEAWGGGASDVVSARALAGLAKLFEWCARLGAPRLAFLKGESVEVELLHSCAEWRYRYYRQRHPGGSKGYILIVEDFERA